MSELGRVLRLDARRTALLVAVPLLTAVGIAASVPSFVTSVAYWDGSVVTLLNVVRLLGPVAAGLAAWTAVRERPLDYLRELTARSPATGVLFDLLLLSAAALVSYLVVTTAVVAVALLRQEAGHPHPLGLAVGAGALVLHIVAGYLSGRVAPHRTTATVVLVATSLWAALRAPGVSWLSLLPPAAFQRISLFTALRPAVLADQVVWTVGVTGALVLGYVVCATRRVVLVVPLVVVLAASVTATLRLHGTGGGATSPSSAKPVCREWPLTVCVHPALRGALPALMAAATPLASRLDGTPGAFTRVEQRPSWAPVAVAGGVAAIHLDEDLAPGFEARAVRQIRDGLMDAAACAVPRRPVSEGYRRLVDAWLAGEEPPAIQDAGAARRFAAWDEQRRRTWLRLHFAFYRACALGPQDFDAWDVRPRLFPKYVSPAARQSPRQVDLSAR